AIDGVPTIPEYDVVVVDEAHELSARVTQASTDELSPSIVERAAKRARNLLHEGQADELEDAADALRDAVSVLPPGRVDTMPEQLADALAMVRDSARACFSALPKEDASDPDPIRQQVKAMTEEVRQIAE